MGHPSSPSGDADDRTPVPVPLSASYVSRHNSVEELKMLERIVVRIEVHDTGVGIRPRDLVDNKLFSPYVQTEVSTFCISRDALSNNRLVDWEVPRR